MSEPTDSRRAIVLEKLAIRLHAELTGYVAWADTCIDEVARQMGKMGQFNKEVAARRADMGKTFALLAEAAKYLPEAVAPPPPPPPATDGTTRWGHSGHVDPVRWNGDCATREEAIEEGREAYGTKETFWVMSGHKSPASSYMPEAEWVIEDMGQRADDEAGESAEDFPQVSPAAHEELNVLLKAWADKHVTVTFWVSDGKAEMIEPGPRRAVPEEQTTLSSISPEQFTDFEPPSAPRPQDDHDLED